MDADIFLRDEDRALPYPVPGTILYDAFTAPGTASPGSAFDGTAGEHGYGARRECGGRSHMDCSGYGVDPPDTGREIDPLRKIADRLNGCLFGSSRPAGADQQWHELPELPSAGWFEV